MSWKLQKVLSVLAIAAALFVTRSELFGVNHAPGSAQHAEPVRTAAR